MSKASVNGPIYNPEGLNNWFNGTRDARVICRQADRNPGGSFLNVPSGMSEINPMKRVRNMGKGMGKGKC